MVGDLWAGTPVTYHAADDQQVTVAPFEHTVLVTRYTASTVRLINRGGVQVVPRWAFLRSWEVLGQMAVIWGEEPTTL